MPAEHYGVDTMGFDGFVDMALFDILFGDSTLVLYIFVLSVWSFSSGFVKSGWGQASLMSR